MYVWVAARFYFLVSFVDAYSRYIVHHKLLMSLDGKSMAVELQTALERLEGVKRALYTIMAVSSSIATSPR
jgi:putative transposase